MRKYVYLFNEGNISMKKLLGGKGANLAEMINLGFPVPYGFTITTEVFKKYYIENRNISKNIEKEIYVAMSKLEEFVGKKFGDPEKPLLVAVRSGASISMPGMMDTILNLGLNDEIVECLVKASKNKRFPYDSYRRFIEMYSEVVMGIDNIKFISLLDEVKRKKGVDNCDDLDREDLKEVILRYKELFRIEVGTEFPQNPKAQLIAAVKAVFQSWESPRATIYRKVNSISDELGTAVNIQEMVFGNSGNDSGAGVVFTRNPFTGKKELYGEFLMNAQGEDVVSGIKTPLEFEQLQEINPKAYNQLLEIGERLEAHYRDMQDIEFTLENGKLFILQTRTGKRSIGAAIKIAVDFVNEGFIEKKEAIERLDLKQIESSIYPRFEPNRLRTSKIIAKGLPVFPGIVTGKVYFNVKEAIKSSKEFKDDIILVRREISDEDIKRAHVLNGILTSDESLNSHTTNLARNIKKCCIVSCNEININENDRYFIDKEGKKFFQGSCISIDGSSGNVYGERLPILQPRLVDELATIIKWIDEIKVSE